MATRIALNANAGFASHFTIVDNNSFLTITNSKKGEAVNISANDSGFTVETVTEGSIVQVEKLNFLYDSSGRLDKVITTSGENILGAINPGAISGETKISGGNGNVTQVNEDGSMSTKLEGSQNELLEEMLTQLKIMNNHLAAITGESIGELDLDLYQNNVRRI